MKKESEIFLKNFIRYRLAEYLHVPHSSITISGTKESYDLEINGTKYCIRLSYPGLTNRLKKTQIWDFDLRHSPVIISNDPQCDYYILVGMEKNSPKRIFVVPFHDAPTSHVRISIKGVSKYANYEI